MVTINQKETQEIIKKGGVVVIDVRTPDEHCASCLENSLNIDFMDKSFSSAIENLDKSGKYLVYCGSGGRSLQAAKIMEKKGFSEIYNLDGGIIKWAKNGMPTVAK